MGPVSRWAVNRPWQAIIAWVVLLFIVGFGVLTHAGQYNDSFIAQHRLVKAQQLLQDNFGTKTNNSSVQVLFTSGNELLANPAEKAAVERMTNQIKAIGSVESVQSPYDYKNPLEAVGLGLVNVTGTIGKVNVLFKVPDAKSRLPIHSSSWRRSKNLTTWPCTPRALPGTQFQRPRLTRRLAKSSASSRRSSSC